MVNGRRLRKDFLDQSEAESWIKDQESRKIPKNNAIPSITVSDTSSPNTWLELYTVVYNRVWKGSKGEKSVKVNCKAVLDHFGLNNPYRHITTDSIDAFIAIMQGKGNGDGTINRKLAAISKMLRFAHARGWIEKVPMIERKQEPMNRLRWLSDAEEAELFQRFEDMGSGDLARLCLFLVDTGARVGEALKLEWRDIDFNQKLVSFWDTKNGQARSIPLTSRVIESLSLQNELCDSGGPFKDVKQTTFNHKWVVVRRAMGLDKDDQFVPHALRHTCASRLVQRGVPILTVKEWLGHKSLAITLRYAHLAPKQLFDAVKVLEDNPNK
jgi:integrase